VEPQPAAANEVRRACSAAAPPPAMAPAAMGRGCLVRWEVPKDNSCLFACLAMLCEEVAPGAARAASCRRLRELCAEEALADPDPATRTLLLGMPVAEYADWIRDETHWGGENEVLALGRHFKVEVAVVSCESLSVLVYGTDEPKKPASRVYLLYTGQHYDALVYVGKEAGEEVRQLPPGPDPLLEVEALALARAHNEEAERLARQRRVKRIKCGGCGALLEDAEAFQAHCGEVDHGDDFSYDCEEVEIVLEGDEVFPDGHLDLSDAEHVHCFSNANAADPLSMLFPAPLEVDGNRYASLEHFWRAAPFLGTAPEVACEIATASTAEEARLTALRADVHQQRPGWAKEQQATLLAGVRAKFRATAGEGLRGALDATGAKVVVNVDIDPWMGMHAQGGISTGRNHLGEALMVVREELRSPTIEGDAAVRTGQVPGSWWPGCC